LKEQGTWEWEQKPLLDEYVYALRAAEQTREGFAWLDHLTETVAREEIDWITLKQVAGNLPTQWDRHVKRATLLADKLVLTPEVKKRHGLNGDEDTEKVGSAIDELAKRRARAS
jgi:4-hydroxyphenylpyruvate dioxygenase-like putative hemolysin